MPDYLTTLEAAELSGYNAEYIRQLIRGGVIQAQMRGRDWWIDKQSLVSYLRAAKKSKNKRFGPRKHTA